MWQCGGEDREEIWSYPAELGSQSIANKTREERLRPRGRRHLFPACTHAPSPGLPTFSPPPLLTNTRGVTRQQEAALIFVSARSPREGSSSSSALPAAHSVSKELQSARPPPSLRAHLPRLPPRPRLRLQRADGGALCLGGLFCLFPFSAQSSRARSPGGRQLEALPNLPRRAPG